MWWLIPCVLGVAQGDEPASEEASADTADVEIVESVFCWQLWASKPRVRPAGGAAMR